MSKKGNIAGGFVFSSKFRLWAIAIAVLCVYGKTLKFDFVGLDDQELILDNYEYIRDISNIPKAFTTDAFYNPLKSEGANVYYRPVLTLSLMLDAQIAGKSPKFYHLTNILLHIISCLLLLKLLLKLKLNPDLAFLFSFLFAVHPVLAQAVGWIPGRNDSLLALFVCASFIFLLKYLEQQKLQDILLHSLFFGLALFTKESAVGLPFICLAFLFLFCSQYPESGYFKSNLFLCAGYLAFLVPWFFLRQQVMSNSTADLSFASLSNSFVENLPLYLQSVQKSIVPYPLSVLSVPGDTNYWMSVSLVLVIAILLVRSKGRDWKKILFGLLWFTVFLLPAFVVHILTGFEHRVYLPLIGILIILSEIDFVRKFSLNSMRHVAIGAGVCIVFLILAVNHASTFSNNYEFWKTAAQNSKHSALARLNYGLALAQKGEQQKAIEIYKEGLTIDPKEPLIHNNLGIIYARRKMYRDAEVEFKKEIEINPKFSDGYFNLGVLYKQAGKDSLMVRMFTKALRVDPKNVGAKKALERYRSSQ